MMRKTSLGVLLTLSFSIVSCDRSQNSEGVAMLDSLYMDTVATVDEAIDPLTLLEEMVDTDKVLRLIDKAKEELATLQANSDTLAANAYAIRLQKWLDAYSIPPTPDDIMQ